jgi:hypothetical protein
MLPESKVVALFVALSWQLLTYVFVVAISGTSVSFSSRCSLVQFQFRIHVLLYLN